MKWLAVLLMVALATPCWADCGDLNNGLSSLKDNFSETPVWEGWVGGNEVILTQHQDIPVANDSSKHQSTWTIIVTAGTHGCIMLHGDGGHLAGTLDSKTD